MYVELSSKSLFYLWFKYLFNFTPASCRLRQNDNKNSLEDKLRKKSDDDLISARYFLLQLVNVFGWLFWWW